MVSRSNYNTNGKSNGGHDHGHAHQSSAAYTSVSMNQQWMAEQIVHKNVAHKALMNKLHRPSSSSSSKSGVHYLEPQHLQLPQQQPRQHVRPSQYFVNVNRSVEKRRYENVSFQKRQGKENMMQMDVASRMQREELVVISEDDSSHLQEREEKISSNNNPYHRSRSSISTPKQLHAGGDMTHQSRDPGERLDGNVVGINDKWKQSSKWLGQKLMQTNVSDVMDKYNGSNRKSIKLADALFDPKMSRFIGGDKVLNSNDQDSEKEHNQHLNQSSNLKSSSPNRSKLKSLQKIMQYKAGSGLRRNDVYFNAMSNGSNNNATKQPTYYIDNISKNDLIDEEEIRKQQKSAAKTSTRFLHGRIFHHTPKFQ